MAGRQDYEERKEARIDKLNAAASKLEHESSEAYNRSHNYVKDIPLGQPNIGGALTNVTNKSRNAMDKAIDCSEKASYYASKAEAAENNNAISSDDPNCIEKLQEKIDNLKQKQEFAKAINKYFVKNGTCKGFKDLTDEQAAKFDNAVKTGYSWEKRPFPSYELTSINQRIKAAEQRIAEIKTIEAMPAETILIEGFAELVSDAETNRVTVEFFNDLPQPAIDKLKLWGFKWAYSIKKWQRLRTPSAWRIAQRIVNEIKAEI